MHRADRSTCRSDTQAPASRIAGHPVRSSERRAQKRAPWPQPLARRENEAANRLLSASFRQAHRFLFHFATQPTGQARPAGNSTERAARLPTERALLESASQSASSSGANPVSDRKVRSEERRVGKEGRCWGGGG